jgi:transcriptional regulator with GAF, ATPase, and Fis domain
MPYASLAFNESNPPMAKTLRYKPKTDPLKSLLLDMAKERSCESVLSLIVSRLTRTPQVALCRIWLTQPICDTCAEQDPGQTECLHLVASSGQSITDQKTWNDIANSNFRRFPFGHRKVGEIAGSAKPLEVADVSKDNAWMADTDWAEAEGVRGFGGQPLIYKDRVLGVLAVFTRMPLEDEWLIWLRMIADHAAAAIANSRAFEEIEELRKQLELENTFLRQEITESQDFGSIIGQSAVLNHMMQKIELVAPTDASVLILGESGTGKELVAREIHLRSVRGDAPLIKVNCASIPRELFESEFFGHTKGAFTGAVRDRAGRFEAANNGTIFLDEVGEIPLELQGKLLRVLQEGEFERVGEETTRAVNIRVVAATNRDLKAEVEAGRFREDLYFRLNVFPIEVAPLRRRKDDIPLLATHFIQASAQRLGRPTPKLSEAALGRLQSYSWPGNIRELQNVIERGVITSVGETLRIDLVSLTSPTTHLMTGAEPVANDGIMTEDELVDLQKKNLRAALDRTGWKIYGPGGTAELLGLRPTTLASRIKKFDISRSA